MPAAAVIPAPIRNIKFVAVKKLVVEFLDAVAWPHGSNSARAFATSMLAFAACALHCALVVGASFTVNKAKRS